MHNDCEGCLLPSSCGIKDLYDNYDDCPCMNCLVKVMCSIVCKERMDYYKTRGVSKEKLKRKGLIK